MNQKKLGGSAINCDAFVSNNVSHVLRTHRNSSQRIITKPSFETKNNNHRSQITSTTGQRANTPESEHSTVRRSKLQQYHVVWLVEQKQRLDEPHPDADEQAVE